MLQKPANAKPGFRPGNDDFGKNCPVRPQNAPGNQRGTLEATERSGLDNASRRG